EDDAVARVYLEPAQAMVLRVEVGGHAALLLQAAPERHADQVALEVVRPLMVGTRELGRVAEMPLAELHAAVRAAVLERVQGAVAIADDDPRLLADERALVVARTWDLGLERHVVPAAPAEDPRLLPRVDLRVRIRPEGHTGHALRRPLSLPA